MTSFSDIIGHKDIISHMKEAIASHKISHCYILSGPKLSGKMMLSEAFAASLVCENYHDEPCHSCHSCKQAEGHNHPDIIYVTHEKPNVITVGEIRQQLIDTVSIRPYSAPYKIYIVEDAQMLNLQAQNALLKTIEEPPEYAVIMLLTTNPQAFLPTILSRGLMLHLHPVSSEVISDYLINNMHISPSMADICVSFSQGNVGSAISLASSSDFEHLRQEVVMVAENITQMDEFELLSAIRHIKDYNLKMSDYFDLLAVWYRDVLLYKATADANNVIFKDNIYTIKSQSSHIDYSGLNDIIEALGKAKIRLEANVNPEITVEMLLWLIKHTIN